MGDKLTLAWAAVGRKSGKVLRNLDGDYAIYTTWRRALADTPMAYGIVRRVAIRVLTK